MISRTIPFLNQFLLHLSYLVPYFFLLFLYLCYAPYLLLFFSNLTMKGVVTFLSLFVSTVKWKSPFLHHPCWLILAFLSIILVFSWWLSLTVTFKTFENLLYLCPTSVPAVSLLFIYYSSFLFFENKGDCSLVLVADVVDLQDNFSKQWSLPYCLC